jgi:hypothetical protein
MLVRYSSRERNFNDFSRGYIGMIYYFYLVIKTTDMKRITLIFLRWFIFYPISIPIVFITGIPAAIIFLIWERIEEWRGKGFDSRGAKALRFFSRAIAKPFFILGEIDKKFNVNGKGN